MGNIFILLLELIEERRMSMDQEMMKGLMVGGVMLLVIMMPLMCCRVSDSTYQSILQRME